MRRLLTYFGGITLIYLCLLPYHGQAQTPTFQGIERIVAPYFMEVPFELKGNLIFLEAEADGHKGQFILDTGAPNLLLNSRYFAPTRIVFKFDALGVTGKVKQVGMRGVDHFNWQDYRAENLDAETMDLAHIEESLERKILGLIGFNLFRGLELEVDYGAKLLRIYKLNPKGKRMTGPPREEADLDAPLRLGNHVPTLKAKIGKKKLHFAIDTGAEVNVLRPNLDPSEMLHFSYEQQAMLLGTGREQTKVKSGITDTLYLKHHKWVEMKTVLAELGELSETYETRLDGVLGYEFLSRGRFSLNFRKRRLLFWFD